MVNFETKLRRVIPMLHPPAGNLTGSNFGPKLAAKIGEVKSSLRSSLPLPAICGNIDRSCAGLVWATYAY